MLALKDALHQDDALLYQLYASARRDEFAMLGLPEQQLDEILRMQYEAQKASYRNQFPAACYQLVMYGSAPIGRMITNISDKEVRLVDISLLPERRGQGFGTVLLKQLQCMAAKQGLPVKLHVMTGNPAMGLYARCGFRIMSETPPFAAMQWDGDRVDRNGLPCC